MRLITSALLAAYLASAGAVWSVEVSDTVKRAQRLLAALGYAVGKPDGVAGRRTHAAMENALKKYGLTYDSQLDEADLAFLGRIAPVDLSIDFGVAVSEIYLLDAADINGDGRLDVAVSAMADSKAQLGVPCCEVPAHLIEKLVPPLPVLIYSTPEGFATLEFPPDANGARSQSGKFFTTTEGTYFVLAKNGEMGLPSENRGERSMVFRIDAGPVPIITTTAEYEGPGITANVEVADLDSDTWPEILINNYRNIGNHPDRGTSTIKRFGPDEALHPTVFNTSLEPTKAHNFIRIEDFDGDGKLDLLAAGEVIKSNNGQTNMTKQPGSYVILDAFGRSTTETDRIYLLPPHFGSDHAGFNVIPVAADGRIFFFEGAMQFLGHQAGGFKHDNLDVFEFSPADKSVRLVTKEVLPKVPRPRETAGGFWIRKADIDFDGIDEIYREKYPRKPQYYDWDGKVFALSDFPAMAHFTPDYLGNQLYLADAELSCTRLVTSPQWLGGRKPVLKVHISTCLTASDLR